MKHETSRPGVSYETGAAAVMVSTCQKWDSQRNSALRSIALAGQSWGIRLLPAGAAKKAAASQTGMPILGSAARTL